MVTQTQDHPEAAKAEAKPSPKKITFRSTEFLIEPPDAWLLDFVHFAERDKVTLALEVALGDDQYATFRALQPHPTLADVGALIEQIVGAFSLNLGE